MTFIIIRLFTTTVCCLWSVKALSLPSVVYLIRHAEKPADQEHPFLSGFGHLRAYALIDYFSSKSLPYGRPTTIFAAAQGRSGSVRSLQTVAPLSQALRLRIRRSHKSYQVKALAREIRSLSSRKVVLVAWSREFLPAIAQALGAVDAPPKWDKQTYDEIWELDFKSSPNQVSLTVLPQKLLPGDKGGMSLKTTTLAACRYFWSW